MWHASRFDGRLDYESFRLRRDEPCVVAAAAAIEAKASNRELAITNGGLDANWLTAHGIPTVTLGCGQRNIHSVHEELDIAEFQRARRIALRLATGGDFPIDWADSAKPPATAGCHVEMRRSSGGKFGAAADATAPSNPVPSILPPVSSLHA